MRGENPVLRTGGKESRRRGSWMDLDLITQRMSQNADAIHGLASGVGEEQARWRPAPEKWSLLEIVSHLADEERDDFRTRLDLLLHDPGKSWPGIDPQGWCAEHGYNDGDLAESLQDFLAERERSIAWLLGLQEPAWDNRYRHPLLGEIEAGSMMTSWLAHDLLHIRQLTKLHFDFFARRNRPYTGLYAGNW